MVSRVDMLAGSATPQPEEIRNLNGVTELTLGGLVTIHIQKNPAGYEVDVHYFYDREGREDYELRQFPNRRATKKFVVGLYLAHINMLVPK